MRPTNLLLDKNPYLVIFDEILSYKLPIPEEKEEKVKQITYGPTKSKNAKSKFVYLRKMRL